MKLLPNFLLVANSPGFLENLPFFSNGNNKGAEAREALKNACVQDLLEAAKEVGQVGSLASEEDQQRMERLAAKTFAFSEPRPAKYPLEGEHRLVYSAAKGASSGRVFGEVVGKVSQLFQDQDIFYNRVNFGPLQIALQVRVHCY